MNCQFCNKQFTKPQSGPGGQNQKFCSASCRHKAHRQRHKEKFKERDARYRAKKRKEITENNPDYIPCLICGDKFVKPLAHAHQIHKISAKEYKERFRIRQREGLITEEHKAVLQENVERNKNIIIYNNLILKGKKTRVKNGESPNRMKKPKNFYNKYMTKVTPKGITPFSKNQQHKLRKLVVLQYQQKEIAEILGVTDGLVSQMLAPNKRFLRTETHQKLIKLLRQHCFQDTNDCEEDKCVCDYS